MHVLHSSPEISGNQGQCDVNKNEEKFKYLSRRRDITHRHRPIFSQMVKFPKMARRLSCDPCSPPPLCGVVRPRRAYALFGALLALFGWQSQCRQVRSDDDGAGKSTISCRLAVIIRTQGAAGNLEGTL